VEVAVTDSEKDPEIITSRHNGYVTKEDVTVEPCIYRLENTKWTLEVVDAEGTSTVWDDEFETDDAASTTCSCSHRRTRRSLPVVQRDLSGQPSHSFVK
jgi:hypothetical protein